DWIPDRAAVDLDVLAALEMAPDAIEDQIVGGGEGAVHFRPGPGQNSPRSADLAPEQDFDRPALRGVRLLVDQDERLAAALMDRAPPVDVPRKAQPIQPDVVRDSVLDVPRPSALALAFRGQRVEVAGTTPVAVARDDDLAVEAPALRHLGNSVRRDVTAL